MIKNLDQLVSQAKQKGPQTISVAGADDLNVLESINMSHQQNLITPVLLGNKAKIMQLSSEIDFNVSSAEIIHTESPQQSSLQAVKLVSSGQADFLMKGMVPTSTFLKAVLDKEIGLATGRILSHCAILSLDTYPKLLMITDGGMNEHPDLPTKIQIIVNAIHLAEKLGINKPKIAALAAVETISTKQPETIDAAQLSKMSQRGQLGNCILDGPLAIDVAISEKSARHKQITSEVAGQVDILLVPSMAAGNMLAKSWIYLAKAQAAGTILGTSRPVVMLSRSDDPVTKLRSIALGVMMC
ncbi:MAG: bifunctional enoyl-CoA hydratase/phosphate acetyltransferase [bacterium]